MLLSLRDSPPGPLTALSEQPVDCILGPSRVMVDPVEQWENEGGRVPSRNVDRWREWCRSTQRAAAVEVSRPVKPAPRDARFCSDHVHACGRCHGPVSLGRSGPLVRLLNYCIAVEQYHCVDAGCGWSGMRLGPGLSARPLLDRRLR